MKRFNNIKGQSIVEVTILVPLLLVALYIPADFGIAFFVANLTQTAAREAARIGAAKTPFNAAATQNEATNRLPTLLSNPTVTAQLLQAGAANCMKVVQVRVSGQYNFFLYQLIRLLGFSAPNSLTLTREARMRWEFQPVDNNMPACT